MTEATQVNPEIQSEEDISHCYDPTQVQAPEQYRKMMGSIPTEDSKMKAKFIPDLLDPNLAKTKKLNPYWAVTDHQHEVGIDGKTGRPILHSHPCQKMFGYKVCPECEKYYELNPLLKSVGEGTAEGKQLKSKLDRLMPRQKGWVNYVTPDAQYVKCLKLAKDMINQLWGKPKTQYKDAVASVIDAMIKMGLNPYDLKNPAGWLLLWKTGEGFGTKYWAAIAQSEKVKMIDGRPRGTETVFEEFALPENIQKFPRSKLPDLRKLQFQNKFTYEESEAFAANPMVTPPRILNSGKGQTNDDAEEAEDSKSQTVAQAMSNPGVESPLPDLGLPAGNTSDIDKVL